MRQIRARLIPLIVLGVLAGIPTGCTRTLKEVAVQSDLSWKILRFTPAEIGADISGLSPGDRKALPALIEAGRIMDTLYLTQVWSGNQALLQELEKDNTAAGLERLHYFKINFGPWSALDDNKPFMDGVPQRRLPGANFYPEDMSKEEFEIWVKALPTAEQERARGFFSTIRRDPSRRLTIVPYSREYKDALEKTAELLRQAAASTDNLSLRKYLTLRADALLTDGYYASDVAWMEVDAPIDVTIGPYETYTDELFGHKAAFEAFITLRDDAETRALDRYSAYRQEFEDNLPLDRKYRNPRVGALAPIRVVNAIFVGGDSKAGVQTAAFNLPNDPRVIREKGSKSVMLKNVQEAKFQAVLLPISKILMDPSQLPDVAFSSFFNHIMAHELMHGLGPHSVKTEGRDTDVRLALRDLYAAIEEAKADITGLWALQYLIDHGKLGKDMERPLYATFLASAFRSVRFGVHEAHGKAVALQFNFLSDAGAILRNAATGTYRVDLEKVKPAVTRIAREILTLEAEGNHSKAKELLDKYGVIRPEMQQALDRLTEVPVDIEPSFTITAREEIK